MSSLFEERLAIYGLGLGVSPDEYAGIVKSDHPIVPDMPAYFDEAHPMTQRSLSSSEISDVVGQSPCKRQKKQDNNVE